MSAVPADTPPAAIGFAPGQYVPLPDTPITAAVGATLAAFGKIKTANGVIHRPLADTEPDTEKCEPGSLFTRSETRAIQATADAWQRAQEAHAESLQALERAKRESADAAPPPPPPDEQRAAALAFIAGNAPEARKGGKPATTPDDDAAASRRANVARAALAGLRDLAAERGQVVIVARGALRSAIVRAAEAARRRAAAKWHAVALQVGEVAGEMDGLDRLLGNLCDRQALDTHGMWRRTSALMAPPVELRPKLARVQEAFSRQYAWMADSPLHDAAVRTYATAAEAALRKMLADAVAWPFP